MMRGQLSAENAKNRWKYLRDCYMKAKKKQQTYIPSSSGTIPKKKIHFTFLSNNLSKAAPSTNKSPLALSATTPLPMSSKESKCSISSDIVDDYSPKNNIATLVPRKTIVKVTLSIKKNRFRTKKRN
ncbi:PREDICTED: uncharacterized protein LOC108687582 [Atta colombica]|uniref:uncharacterized protein LOC108687582 n=1 Tax=Atta colombica TaxID=520822 RepID=UPI00084BF918|nr:PREDICTED: uncharacterized protein LOC108687582 [Atta colombica]